MNIEKRNIDEVSFIRPILIILLVLFHSFAPWNGGWPSFEGYEGNVLYKYIASLSYSFMLPAFVGVSGYVWGFQREILGRIDNLRILIRKKLYRLYVPSILFSTLYFFMFQMNINEPIRISELVVCKVIVSGTGHLWFLPMLFWCFTYAWLLLHFSILWRSRLIWAFFLSFLGGGNSLVLCFCF